MHHQNFYPSQPIVSLRLNSSLKCLGAALLAVPFAVSAQTINVGETANTDTEQTGWSVGLLGLYGPEYIGSDDNQGLVVPNIAYDGDHFYGNVRDGVGYYLIKNENISLGAGLGLRFGRDEDDDPALEGLGDIDPEATAIINSKWRVKYAQFGAKVETGLEGETGTRLSVSAASMLPIGQMMNGTGLWGGVRIIPQVQVNFGDSDFQQAHFGVNSAQSARSGYDEYDPDSGITSVDLNAAIIMPINDNWSTQFFAQQKLLMGDAKDSPFVFDDTPLTLGLGVNYHF